MDNLKKIVFFTKNISQLTVKIMRCTIFIVFFLFCWRTNLAQNAQDITFVPQIPPTQNNAIRVFSNSKAGLMASVEKKTLKFWDLKTRLLLDTKEIFENVKNIEKIMLSDEGGLCFRGDYGEGFSSISQNSAIKSDTILFLTNQHVWIDKYPKIFVCDLKTNKILAEKTVSYGQKPLNTDLSKYLIFSNDKKIEILDAKTFQIIFTVNSDISCQNAFFDAKYKYLVLHNALSVNIYDLKNTQPQKINTLQILSGAENIRISDDFPLLFYVNLKNWGIIDFKENKTIYEQSTKYPNQYSGNGVFVPHQKALFQFRNGQLGIFDIIGQFWQPFGTKLSQEQTVKLNFPQLFLAEVATSSVQKLEKMQNVMGASHHKYNSTQYFDNKNYKIYQITQPSTLGDTKNAVLTIFDAKKRAAEHQTELKMIEKDYNIQTAFENNILVYKNKTSYTDCHYQIIDYQAKKVLNSFNSPKEGDCDFEQLSKKSKYALFRTIIPKNIIKIVDVKSDKIVFEVAAGAGIISADENFLICVTDNSSGILEVFDIKEKKSIKKIYYDKTVGYAYLMHADEVDNQLFMGTSTGSVAIFNLQNHEFLGKIQAMESPILCMYSEENFLYIQSKVETKIFDKKTRKLHLGLIMKKSDDYKELQTMTYTNENYYMVDKTLIDFVAFKKNGKAFTFDQFDLQYNRPDIVLERMGFASKALIESYRKAYEKRLKKLNFDPKNFEKDKSFNVPELALKNQENYYKDVKNAIYPITFEAKDALFNLDRLNLYVNGVPIFGTKGKDLKGKNTKTYNGTLSLELCEGKNLIEISVLNQKGVESLKEKLEINFIVANAQKPVLHLVTVGVSEYENTQMNLKYATKDGKDLADLLQTQVQTQKDVFQSVKYHALFDKDATKENILNLKKELQKTNINDVVIVFVSGHGLLDSELDYFLATNNIDFDNPKTKGLPYDELENLLDSIPARQKILMMDACHSGEIDKEEIALVTKNEAISNDKNIKFKNFDKKTVTNKNVGLQNSFELSKQMFTDLRKGSGTTVLSAAGGVQLAQESSEWQNGAFTYCVLTGLKNMKADLNKDGKIMLSELQNYLFTEVPRITGGLQQPTSRIENLVNDFRIW